MLADLGQTLGADFDGGRGRGSEDGAEVGHRIGSGAAGSNRALLEGVRGAVGFAEELADLFFELLRKGSAGV